VFNGRFRGLLELRALGVLPGNQAVQIVAIGTVGLEESFIEEPLDPTAEAHLIGVFLRTNGPAHFAVPASPENHDGSAGYPSCQQAQRPYPARLLLFLAHDRTQSYCLHSA
jgi:hypothetical protein